MAETTTSEPLFTLYVDHLDFDKVHALLRDLHELGYKPSFTPDGR